MANLSKIKVSVIIPARNEERFIQKTIESLKSTTIRPLEIVVVVNGSDDKTFEISKRYADKVLNFSEALGPSAARNEGAKIAGGGIFVFLDADTKISDNAIAEIVNNCDRDVIGVCSAVVVETKKDRRLKAKIFYAFKNIIHKTNIYKGSVALIFCRREVFFRINGFDKDMWVGELGDFIKRAVKTGAKYKFLDNCYVNTSLRRYEKKWGYAKMILFWIEWKVSSLFGTDKNFKKKYFQIKK